jgi:hypothetical protein
MQPHTQPHRSGFELARAFREVVGIDLSQTFIDMANVMKADGQVAYSLKVEGDITVQAVARLDSAIDRQRCTFLQVRMVCVVCVWRGGGGQGQQWRGVSCKQRGPTTHGACQQTHTHPHTHTHNAPLPHALTRATRRTRTAG